MYGELKDSVHTALFTVQFYLFPNNNAFAFKNKSPF